MDALVKKKQCDADFNDKENAKSCYLQEVALLVTDHCIEIRKTEALLQEECENFVYRLVMKPTSFFPVARGYILPDLILRFQGFKRANARKMMIVRKCAKISLNPERTAMNVRSTPLMMWKQ